MKRFFSKFLLCLSLITCIGLVGCGGISETPPDSSNEIVEPENPVEPQPPKEEQSKIDFEQLAKNILEKLSTYYAFDYEDEEIVKLNISEEKLEIELNLVDCIDDSDSPDIQEYVKQEVSKFEINDSEINFLNIDCVITITINKPKT